VRQNPGWGTIKSTADKLEEFYGTDQLSHAVPVPGSLDAMNRLREMGYSLIIVTARSMLREAESTAIWVDNHFNGKLRDT
jgi:phosphoglycolate phosphatase-like HAD superfamily hydrolase